MTSAAAPPLKVVLDTNIYVAAFHHPKGNNFKLWVAAREGKYHLVVSPALVREIARVLRSDFQWPDEAVQKLIRLVGQVATIVSPRMQLDVVIADPTDNRVLECAVAGRVDLIVSNDHHLLDLTIHDGIPIVAGPDFRRMLGIQ